jgi:hypothetical protein
MNASLRRTLARATVALLALLSAITSLRSDFTYDDRGVILENARVHTLRNLPHLFAETYWPARLGGDGYRPLIVSLFTVEWAVGHGVPLVFHLVNILLAVAVSLAVFWCARAVLSEKGAWVAAALFAVHPVHVEVTGNVVGQSELLVALFLALAVGLYLRRRASHTLSGRDVASITALFALALLCKEHAIVLPGLLVAAELTVLSDDDWRVRLRESRLLLLALIAVALAYLFARGLVQRDLAGFQPFPIFRFLNMGAVDRIGTMMNEMPRIAQLLIFPTHLSADYSPGDVLIATGPALSQLPGLFICLGALVLAAALRDRSRVASFGILWTAVAFLPVSNLILPAGFITAERTLFFPSIGVVLIAGAAAEHLARHASVPRQRLAMAALALLLVLGVGRSIDRQRVWKNNDVFFHALMRDAPNGYRAHFLYARHMGLNAHLREMELEYRRAIRIFPYDASMTMSIADAYARAGLYEPAVTVFEWTYSVTPKAEQGRYEYVYCLAKLGRWKEVRAVALDGLRFVPPREVPLMRAAVREANIQLGLPHL